MSKILFVVGPPGVGKTTLVRSLLGMQGGELPLGGYLVEKPKWTVTDTMCAAGHYTGGTFDGADMVPYNGAQAALAFWNANLTEKSLTIFDGDRFSNATALSFLRNHELHCVHLSAPKEILTERRALRGSKQNPSWMMGRETKAANFTKTFAPERRHEVTADASPEAIVKRVRALIVRAP